MLPLGIEAGEPHGWDWEPCGTLTRAIQRGLTPPWRAFTVYLKSKQLGHNRACLSFTVDGRVVLGVSIDDADEQDESLDSAKQLLTELIASFSAERGFVGCEEPPPLSDTPSDDERWLVRWHRDAS